MTTVFNRNNVKHLEEPLFFGSELNVARTETVKHKIMDDLSTKQLGFYWRPTEIDLTKDIIDYQTLEEHEKHMFIANLKYQTLLDSIQGRAPVLAFLPICSDPAAERWIETWSFSETIHSESYTHIVRTVLPTEMSIVFDSIIDTEEIMKRADSIGKYYDNVLLMNAKRALRTADYVEREHIKAVYLCMHAVNALEAIRFYVSFAVTFSFGEQKQMEGVAKTMSLIARDEALHLKGTQWFIRQMQLAYPEITAECEEEAVQLFLTASAEEKDWAKYLMKLGPRIGLNETILCKYVDYITQQRMRAVGLPVPDSIPKLDKTPLPWMRNWLNTDDKQVAPQETEITSYVTGGVSMTQQLDLQGIL